MGPVDESKIRQRRAEVAHLLDRHKVAIAYLEKELEELDVAVRVCERFHDRPDFSDLLPAQPEQEEADVRKPAGTPTMPEMIMAVLRKADAAGLEPLEPKDIVAAIRATWWPDAPASSVGPIAWRMWKDRRLAKVGSAYSLPKDETPSVSPPGVSNQGYGIAALLGLLAHPALPGA